MVRLLAGLPKASPESTGLSARPFADLVTALRRETRDLECLSGAAHVVLHEGKCVFAHADGWASRKAHTRFSLDTLCMLHGCTKPLVAAAFLTLVDAGKVCLSDPVSKYITFPDHVVATDVASGGKRKRDTPVVKAKRIPTLRHLMTMTAGIGYEHSPQYADTMRRIRRGEINDLASMCESLCNKPLQSQPGSRYEYSFTVDILGRVCEVVSGKRLDRFVEQSLLKPLGMKDTHFVVPKSKKHRVAVLYDAQQRSGGGKPYVLKPWDHKDSAPGIMSGGGGILSYKDPGMYSTAKDYASFCHMILKGGVGPKGRVLRAATARLLWGDSLARYGKRDGRLPGWHDADEPGAKCGFWDFNGWSLLNTHLVFKTPPRGTERPRQASSMWMGGGGGTYWIVDKRRDLVALSFTQCFGGRTSEEDGLGPRGNDVTAAATQAFDQGREIRGAAKKRMARRGKK